MAEFPPPPETLRDRIAFAIAAHDIRGGEGRMEDNEFAALELVLRAMYRICGSSKATNQILGFGGDKAMKTLRRFAGMERGFRTAKGNTLMHAHLIALDWPTYRGAADAALSVLLERPEAVTQIVSAELCNRPSEG